MDQGQRFGHWKLLRFNGHFFRDAEVLPLTRADVAVLYQAAQANWQYVEPTIFGTLLTRALNPKERHRLGAEYTPREYVERVVRQTVDVPLRERWAPVQAHAAELAGSRKKKDRDTALGELRDFHAWMRGLRFLDPACGSGNFLYVTLHMVKRLELEVLRAIEEITGNPELGIEEVGPWQFYGIEIKLWAREIAELTLWIGYHQFWMEHHKGVNPPEPVLKDTGTLELRDAVLDWDEIVEAPARSRPDPTPRIVHPVTGKLVPDPEARLVYNLYTNARPARWPQADFIIGNPPYLGQRKQRESFGHGYVDALRSAYPDLPDSADFVMYWWFRAAVEVAVERSTRAGLITTNTLAQEQNRAVIESAASLGAQIVWAIPDHPWVDDAGAADVRVAMSVIALRPAQATLLRINKRTGQLDEFVSGQLNHDLSIDADVAGVAAIQLRANTGICTPGFKLHGAGLVLTKEDAERLIQLDSRHREIVRPYRNGKDLTSRPREVSIVDFALRNEDDALQYPVLYDLIRTRVKPERDANAMQSRRDKWWLLGQPNPKLRGMTAGLMRMIVTVFTSKHRFFTFLSSEIAPDQTLVCIGSDSPTLLGYLSSSHHVIWSLAAGGRLGIGNDPRYNKSKCFDPFPFPDPPQELREEIGRVAERLDQHRKDAIARDERVTMTGMYNRGRKAVRQRKAHR
jgi:hypothetical protein